MAPERTAAPTTGKAGGAAPGGERQARGAQRTIMMWLHCAASGVLAHSVSATERSDTG